MTSSAIDPYKALGVEKDADVASIKTAYRKLVLKCHPDKVQDPALKAIKQDEFQRVQQAYEILVDEGKRRDYDDEVKLKKLREEVYKNASHQSSSRPSSKTYYEYNINIKTAEPPSSFRPGPPPASQSYSPYSGSPHQTSSSFERDLPSKVKAAFYEEDRKARRTTSYEKARREDELPKSERRRKEDDEDRRRRDREEREREKERERKENIRREEKREKEKEERKRLEREKLEKEARRLRRERERAKEERDRQLRREQDDKRSKKTYIENESEEDQSAMKKKSSSSTKKPHDSPRRDKSLRREESPNVSSNKIESNLMSAANYMQAVKRKGSKSGPSTSHADPTFSTNFQDPENWKASATDSPRGPRRSSQDEKYTAMADPVIEEDLRTDPRLAPSLRKSHTSPIGHPMSGPIPMHNGPPMPHANSSAPRMPGISRAHTMHDYTLESMVQEPSTRHSSKSGRRRGSIDQYEEDPRAHRSSGRSTHAPRYYPVVEESNSPRPRHYREPEQVFAVPSPSRATFDKVKQAPRYGHGPVYQARYEHADMNNHYADLPHYPENHRAQFTSV